MSSIKTWGFDPVTERIVNIRDCVPREEFTNRIKCTSDSCDCVLILNQGAKKDWYFRHPTSKKGGCHGASVESVLHKYAKQTLLNLDSYTVPDGEVFFKKDNPIHVGSDCNGGFYIASMQNVPFLILDKNMNTGVAYARSAEHELTHGVRPDVHVSIVTGSGKRVDLCYEVYVSNKVSAYKMNKYRKFIEENEDRAVFVIEIDLSDKSTAFDTEGWNDEWLKSQKLIMSSKMHNVQKTLEAARFEYHTGKVLCPAHEERGVVLSRNCPKCPFNIDRGICYGRSLIGSQKDFNLSVEERLDKYGEQIPAVVGIVNYDTLKAPFGRCESCKDGQYMLVRGAQSKRVAGVPVYLGCNDKDAYLMCKSCGHIKSIKCPACKKTDMRVYEKREVNTKGMKPVFLTCQDFDGCNTSITIYNHACAEPSIADEVVTAGGLDKFLSSRTFKSAFERIKELRRGNRLN